MIFVDLRLVNNLITTLITFVECNIPIFIASGLISFDVNSICFDISLADIEIIDFTPVVF